MGTHKPSLSLVFALVFFSICSPILCGLLQTPWLSFWQEWGAVVLWSTTGLVVFWQKSKNETYFVLTINNGGLALFFLVGSVAALSAIWTLFLLISGAEYYPSFWWLIYMLGAALALVLGQVIEPLADNNVIESTATGFVAAALIGSFQVIAQMADFKLLSTHLIDLAPDSRPGGNLGQPNLLGTLLLLGCASATFLHSVTRLSRLAYASTLFLLGLGIAATQSRAALLGCVAIVLLALFAEKKRFVKTPWQWLLIWATGVWIFSYLQVPMHLSQGNETLVNGLSSRSFADRLSIYKVFIWAIFEMPLTGWGPGRSLLAQFYTTTDSFTHASQVARYAHNLPLDLLLNFGIPLGAMILGFGACIWFCGVMSIRNTLSLWAGSCVTVVLVHSMLEFPFAYAYLLVPTILLASVWANSCGLKEKRKFATPYLAYFFMAILIINIACLFLVARDYSSASADFRAAKMTALGFSDAYKKQKLSNQKSTLLLTDFDSLMELQALAPTAVLNQAQLEKAEEITALNPYPIVILKYAQLLTAAGNEQKAVNVIRKIKILWPGNAMAQTIKFWMETENAPKVPKALQVESNKP